MSAILKLETLTDNFGNDKETFVQILDVFLEEVPQDIALLKKQVGMADYYGAGETSHKVKSSYRMLDMVVETMLLQEIENRAKAQVDTHEIVILFEQLEEIYKKGIIQVSRTREYFSS